MVATFWQLGPFFFWPGTTVTLKRLLYCRRRLARPVFCFFLGVFSTLGVWPLTFPARARDPWTFPAHCISTGAEARRGQRHTSEQAGANVDDREVLDTVLDKETLLEDVALSNEVLLGSRQACVSESGENR
jgi:hypothetical protein